MNETTAPRSAENLSPSEVAVTLEALRSARETFRLKPRTRRLYAFLRLVVYVNVAAILVLLAGVIWDVLWKKAPGRLDVGVGLVFVGTTILAPFFLLANIGTIGHVWRQRRRLKELGLKELSDSLWKARRKAPGWERVWVTLVLTIGLVMVLSSVIAGLAAEWKKGTWAGLIAIIIPLVALGLTIVGFYFLQRGKQRLELVAEATQLEKALLESQKQAGEGHPIAVPLAVLKKAARIESTQIAQQRVEAIAESLRNAADGYAVQITRDVFAQKAALDSTDRSHVDELIQRLSDEPRPPGATMDEAGRYWRLNTGNGEVEIRYRIDEPQRRIQLIGVSRVVAADSVNPSPQR